MSTGFDQIAQDYDADFVQSAVGNLQRQIVWNYLAYFLKNREQLNILELNCGTGEDAIWMAEKGHHVLATDSSEQMIQVARSKTDQHLLKGNLSFALLDIANPDTYPTGIQFDLIFSNFGGLNCLSPQTLSNVIPDLTKIMKPNGRLIAVIMPKFCLWETFYFFLKAKFRTALRRNRSGPLAVPVGENKVQTWYFAPSQIKKILHPNFLFIRKRPVGFFLPPSYLENYFSRHLKQLQLLNWKEKLFTNWAFLSGFSDHFLIDLEVRS